MDGPRLAPAKSVFRCCRSSIMKSIIGAKRDRNITGVNITGVNIKRIISNLGFAADVNQGYAP